MSEVKQNIESGWPITVYEFTGNYVYGSDGHYKAARNKKRYRMPEYQAKNGHKIYDATQKEYIK